MIARESVPDTCRYWVFWVSLKGGMKNEEIGNRNEEMETAGLSMVLNHRIAASKGVSEGESWA